MKSESQYLSGFQGNANSKKRSLLSHNPKVVGSNPAPAIQTLVFSEVQGFFTVKKKERKNFPDFFSYSK